MSQPLVILVGRAGVGKTTVRTIVADYLGFASACPDDFPRRWNDVYWMLDRYPCVLECCRIPRAVRKRLTGAETIVELYAPENIRRARLQHQGHDAQTITERLGQTNGNLGYETTITPTLRVDTSGPPGPVADRIVQAVSGL